MNSISRLTGGRLNIVCIVTMMVLSSILIMTPMVERASAGQDNWWNSSWGHRVLITFNASQIQGSHTNFPVLVIINSTLASKSDNGNSSRFVAYWDNSTALNAELEGAWNNSGNNTIWLNMTHFDSSSHYKVWYYYNCSSVAASWNGAGVWDSHYMIVQHLEETTGTTISDSTLYGNDGTPQSGVALDTLGKIDGADGFDGDDDYVYLGNPASLAINTSFTLTAWVKMATVSDDEMIISRWDNVGHYSYGICINNTNPRVLASSDGAEVTNKTFTDLNFSQGEWHYVVGQWNGSHLLCYIDGVKSSQSEVHTGGVFTGESYVRIGANLSGCLIMHFNGSIDEVRISNVARSADWINTSYNNQNNTSSFMSFGSEQDPIISVSSPIPSDEATNISISLSYFNITISDAEGETMNITWQTNESGSWSTFNVTTSVNNGTYNATNTSWVGDYNTKYWWRVLVNDSNVNWNNQTFYFTTRAQYVPDEPSSFTATTVNSDQIDFSWIKGINASYTRIQQKIGSYPTSISDGTNVYNNTGSSCSNASLSEGTTYYYRAWSWNNTDNIWSSGNASVSNTTNNIPAITTPRPTNQSTNTRLTPQQNITINDADGDAMILTWYSNSSGSWVAFGSNSSVGNGTYHQANSNFSGYDTKYWWNVTVTDGLDTNTSATYHFTTRSQYVPDPPTNFSASANGQTQIDLSWTKGNKADNTSIEWNTIETWSRGDGTELYNGTGNSTSHSGLSPETTRYYQAWSWNDTGNCWSISNATCSATTESSGGAPPGEPGGGDTTPPTTPTNVRCTTPEADDTPSFAWDAATDSSGISGYYVKIDNGTDIEVGDVLTWTSADNVEDGNHTFYVKAKDASSNGNIGSYGSCSFTIDTIEGADPPIAVANGPYIGLTFQVISFDGSDSHHDAGGTITNYTWDFGDGTSGYGINPTHIYNLSGTYTITLTVTDTEGLTDSDTTAATIELDSDGDGWSDDMENSYGTNATDPTDQLKDTDGDGIPDDDSPDGNYTGDPDDDDDGLNDEIEEKLGSDPKNATDVKSLDMEGNYIIDIDGDGQHDKFYNATSKINTTIEVQDGGTYLIDSNGNGKWDYTYDPKSGEILPYETQEPKREFPWLLIIIGTITAIVVIIFLLFKTGFLYVEEKKPEE